MEFHVRGLPSTRGPWELRGDQLKTASDPGRTRGCRGLLFQQGYFRQVIDKDGAQQALYPTTDPATVPIHAVRRTNGEWLRMGDRRP